MSRYVSVEVAACDRVELVAALQALALPHEAPGHDRVMLQGSLECPGEPVDVRLPEGTRGAVEDFGFVVKPDGGLQLVCGELDRRLLTRELLAPLRAQLARARLAAHTDDIVEETVEADGTRRVVVRDGRESS